MVIIVAVVLAAAVLSAVHHAEVVVMALTVVPGRATPLQGVVHMVLLVSFVFLAANP